MAGPIRQRLGKYEIIALLGKGDMTVVYKAYQPSLDRYIAVKLLHPFLADDPEFKDRFERQARNVARLLHPNIVQVYDFNYDTESESYYMVMEFIAGQTLKDYLILLGSEGKFIEVREAVTLTRQVAEALDYVHSRRMIHCNVRPGHILLKLVTSESNEDTPFRAVLTGFSHVKFTEGSIQSISNNPPGALPYMSPEQAQFEKLDGRADLFALGVMLYELTTGRLPFIPRSIVEAIKMHTSVEPDKPSAVRANISKQLEDVIMKAVAKKREDRYQTCGEFAKALRQLETISALGTNAPPLVQTPPEQVSSLSTYLQSMHSGTENP